MGQRPCLLMPNIGHIKSMGMSRITSLNGNIVGGGKQHNLSSVGQSVNKRDTKDISALIKANKSKSNLNTNLTMVNEFFKKHLNP